MFNQTELAAILNTIPWFMELTKSQREQLALIADLRQVKAGEHLYCEGEQIDFLYVVLEGQVAVEMFVPSRGQIRILTAEALDVVGWSSMTPIVRQRTTSATALVPSKVIALRSEALRFLCEEDHELGYIITKRIANVVASRLLITRLQLFDLISNGNPEKHWIRTLSE